MGGGRLNRARRVHAEERAVCDRFQQSAGAVQRGQHQCGGGDLVSGAAGGVLSPHRVGGVPADAGAQLRAGAAVEGGAAHGDGPAAGAEGDGADPARAGGPGDLVDRAAGEACGGGDGVCGRHAAGRDGERAGG